MDAIFYPVARIHLGEQHNVPRQPHQHASDSGWEEIKFKEYQIHQRKIFIRGGCDQQSRSFSGIFPTEELLADILTKPLQGKSYQIMRSNLINMLELYVDPGKNAPEKGSNTAGVSENKKHVEFNQDAHMKYNLNFTQISQTF